MRSPKMLGPLWWLSSVPSQREAVNSARSGRKQR